MSLPLSTGIRMAGGVLAIGYLTGIAPGAVVTVVGALALIGFGRAMLLERADAIAAGAALAVAAGGLGIAALRWGTLDLGELRGAQAVLGPTILVGPTGAAVSTAVAMAACLAAVSVWLATPRPRGRAGSAWLVAEAAIASLAIVTVFVAPQEVPSTAVGFALWAGIVVAATAIVFTLAVLMGRGGQTARWIPVIVGGAAVAGTAGFVAATL